MNYFDILLAKKLEDDRDPRVEGLSVSENGRYHEDGVVYDPVIVAVPEPTLISKSITANGTYSASDDNADGYSSVTVNVSGYSVEDISPVPTDIASFSASELPMPTLKIGIEPVQSGSGDPSPQNIRPISGWTSANVSVCGVNVWDEDWELGYLDNNGNPLSVTDRIRTKNFIPVKSNMQLRFFSDATVNNFYIFPYFYDADKNMVGKIDNGVYASGYNNPFTVPSNAVYMKFWVTPSYGATYNHDISINYPSTDTTYHAYNGKTYTIDLDGTRYGGTLDVVSGVLTVDRVSVDIGSMTYSEYGSTSDCTQYYTTALDALAKSNSQVMSDIFVYGESVTPWTMRITAGTQGKTYFRTTKDLYANPTAFKTAMNGHQLVYELATPTTIQLTPVAVKSLVETNLFADCGQILEGEYFKPL